MPTRQRDDFWPLKYAMGPEPFRIWHGDTPKIARERFMALDFADLEPRVLAAFADVPYPGTVADMLEKRPLRSLAVYFTDRLQEVGVMGLSDAEVEELCHQVRLRPSLYRPILMMTWPVTLGFDEEAMARSALLENNR